jgi:hypothetical protein
MTSPGFCGVERSALSLGFDARGSETLAASDAFVALYVVILKMVIPQNDGLADEHCPQH